MKKIELRLVTGGKTISGKEGKTWNNPDNPFNETDDEDGGDEYEAYEEGLCYEDDDERDQ